MGPGYVLLLSINEKSQNWGNFSTLTEAKEKTQIWNPLNFRKKIKTT
jgi:hypothetical protein